MAWAEVRRRCARWLKSNYYREGREWQYKNIPPRIMVEKLLLDDDGNVPNDYKFHCFNGRVGVVRVDIDRHANHRRNFYDVTWTKLPFTWSACVGSRPLWPQGRDIECPPVLDQVVVMTEEIARSFTYIRVDWYVLGSAVYFGEVTFHHGGGYERILPFEWDHKLGETLRWPGRTPGRATAGKHRD